jgi:hypothetical protein
MAHIPDIGTGHLPRATGRPRRHTGMAGARWGPPRIPPGSTGGGRAAGAPRPPADLARVRTFVVLTVRLHHDRTVEVTRAIRAAATGQEPRPAGPSPLFVDLLDASGAVLSTHPLRQARTVACGCTGGDRPGDPEACTDVVDAVEWDERATGLAFHTGGEPLARLAVGEAPDARLAEPRVRPGIIHTAWVARHPRERPDVMTLYSADDGATWQRLGFADDTEGAIDLPTYSVPGGSRCRLRLVASAELAATDLVSGPFEVPVTPRTVAIVSPTDGAVLPANAPVALAGRAYSPDGGVCPPGELHWESDVDGDLGYGHRLAVRLRPGTHRITATAPDGTGGRCTATALVMVR